MRERSEKPRDPRCPKCEQRAVCGWHGKYEVFRYTNEVIQMSGTALPTGSIDDSERDECDGGVKGVGHPLIFLMGIKPDFSSPTWLCFLLENPPRVGGKN